MGRCAVVLRSGQAAGKDVRVVLDRRCLLAPYRFSGTNLLAMKVAPWGSASTVIRTHGASNGGVITRPPSSDALAAAASASSTANVTPQAAGSPPVIGVTAATTSSKPSGAPISFIP